MKNLKIIINLKLKKIVLKIGSILIKGLNGNMKRK